MQTIVTESTYGKWTKTLIVVDGKECRRLTGPTGTHSYDYDGARGVVRLRNTSKMATLIEAEIVKQTAK